MPSLGLVNDLLDAADEQDDDETRQAIGDQDSTATKWHKHTVKVYQMLQRTLKTDADPEDSDKPTVLHYNELSKDCSRRTAASVFFELLQLKTWDFIEIDQQEPYGDILISVGNRFHEPPPNP